MKALVWMGKRNVEVQRVEDPRILRPRAVYNFLREVDELRAPAVFRLR